MYNDAMRTQNFARLLITPRFYLGVLIVVSIAVGLTARDLGDFDKLYLAGQALRSGINPYTMTGFYSPIFVALAFAPLSLLTLSVAFHLYAGFVFFGFGMAFYLLTQRRIGMTLLLMCSPLPLWSAWYGNIEAWVLLGAALTPTIGVWLVLVKPQIGLVMALLFLVQRWDETKSIRSVMRLVLPVGVALFVSLMLGMLHTTPVNEVWNISIWPIGLIIGIPATLIALYYRANDAALFAGPFVSPYLGGPASFVGALPLLARRWQWAVVGAIASWGVLIVWRLRI